MIALCWAVFLIVTSSIISCELAFFSTIEASPAASPPFNLDPRAGFVSSGLTSYEARTLDISSVSSASVPLPYRSGNILENLILNIGLPRPGNFLVFYLETS